MTMSNQDVTAFEVELREWLDATVSAYLASNPDFTPEGFRAYVRKLPDAMPTLRTFPLTVRTRDEGGTPLSVHSTGAGAAKSRH